MKKILAVFKREYLQAVRKKSFIIMTFLMPFLMSLIMAVPTVLLRRGLTEKNVVVIDGTGQLRGTWTPEVRPAAGGAVGALQNSSAKEMGMLKVDYVSAIGDPKKAAEPYIRGLSQENKKAGADALLVIPADALTNSNARMTYYSRSAADLIVEERMSRMANKALQRVRLGRRGVKEEEVDAMLADIRFDAVQVSKSGEQKRGGEMNLAVGFVFAALLVIPVFIYGIEIMRGIVQEKTDRVVEVLISSMTATELLTGKIAGLAAVGLTQLGVWMMMANLLAAYSVAAAYMAGMNILQFLRPVIFVYFFVFFLLGYLLFVCVYAIGGAASNTEKDAQQLLAPFVMLLMLPWFLMVPIITNPDSTLSIWLSLIPLFAPITMFIRVLISEPPAWQIAVSIAVTIATILLLLKVAAKVFRVGILAYGKRATLPELWRWLKQA